MNNTRYLFINPVGFFPEKAPIIGIPSLQGLLNANSINTEFINLNGKYINYLLTEKGMNDTIDFYNNLLKNKLDKSSERLKKIYRTIISQSNITLDTFKYHKEYAEYYKHILQSEKYSSDCILTTYAHNCVSTLLTIIRDSYEPIWDTARIDKGIENSDSFAIDINFLKELFCKDYNILYDFYSNEADNIINKNPGIIGISCNHPREFTPTLFLCYLLKQKTQIHINIGGNLFENNYKNITNLPELFDLFFDSISINDGHQSIIQLAQYANREIKINDVPNLIYKQNNSIIINPASKKVDFKDLPFQSFNGFKKDEYLSPELILPIQTSKSCYWAKCIYCICNSQKYEIKDINKVIDEIEYQLNKHQTKYFYFWDNSISPALFNKFADKLKERKLNIKYSAFARLENQFDKNLLKKIKDSGCCAIYWGLDSVSQKTLDFVNKGINIKSAKRILKDASDAGIFNCVYFILGFPNDTEKELKETYNYIRKNKKYIHYANVIDRLFFPNGSILKKEEEKYKKMILIPVELSRKYIEKINSIYPRTSSFNTYPYSTYNIIKLDKIGLKKFVKARFIIDLIDKNKILFNIYKNFFQLYSKYKIRL